jgi:metal-sulfur cluster biosynthetic enzyme
MTIETSGSSAGRNMTEQQVCDILRDVIDPEVGMNIVALGLVYRIDATAERVTIQMTMTSPACPMGEMIVSDASSALAKALPSDVSLDVQLVWEPPWDPSMMDAATKLHFGWKPDEP